MSNKNASVKSFVDNSQPLPLAPTREELKDYERQREWLSLVLGIDHQGLPGCLSILDAERALARILATPFPAGTRECLIADIRQRIPSEALNNMQFDRLVKAVQAEVAPSLVQAELKTLSGETDEDVVEARLSQLAKLSGIPRSKLSKRLEAVRAENKLAEEMAKDDIKFCRDGLQDCTDQIDWQIQDILPSKYSILLSGQSGAGKSLSAIDLASAIAGGSTWLGKQAKQGKVLILNSDQGENALKQMLRTRLGNNDCLLDNIAFKQGWNAGEFGLAQLKAWIEKHHFSLVIMDSVRACICKPLGLNQNDAETGYKLQQIAELCTGLGASFLAIHHDSKSKENSGVNKPSGSTAIVSGMDACWHIGRSNEGNRLSMPKTRGYSPIELDYRIDFKLGTCNLIVGGQSPEEEEKAIASPKPKKQEFPKKSAAKTISVGDGVRVVNPPSEMGVKAEGYCVKGGKIPTVTLLCEMQEPYTGRKRYYIKDFKIESEKLEILPLEAKIDIRKRIDSIQTHPGK